MPSAAPRGARPRGVRPAASFSALNPASCVSFTLYAPEIRDAMSPFYSLRPFTWLVPRDHVPREPIPWPIACYLRPEEVDLQRSLLLVSGHTMFPSSRGDDPLIMETWL